MARARALGGKLRKLFVRYEPAYVLPWLASREVSTSVLLEHGQLEYSRRRRGVPPETTIVVTRYDRRGHPVLERDYIVRPGNPVMLDVTSDEPDLEFGFYRLTESSQYYVQIRSRDSCALTHGRSTVVAHYDGLSGAIFRRVGRMIRPYRKGLNLVCSGDTYQTVIVFNLSSVPNLVQMATRYEQGERQVDRVLLPAFGSHLARFRARHSVDGAIRRGHVRMRASAPFELYVLQTRRTDCGELLSIQHVN
jgi:hypothetical protein